jgi:alkanesulfonate monooxygenase SsuD/methylene tetrahydromethanopterin reductase-like flavin-dependent oxidoreductase (luciferase family)
VARIGIALLPQVNPAIDDRWRRVESYGFAHAWCIDHLAWRDMAGSPWHATVPVLCAAATTTERLPIGPFVSSPNYRHPVPFSRELMTLDVMSGGRLLVGVGVGTTSQDATILGGSPLNPKQRMDRFEEFLTLLDRLLRQPSTTWSGDWFAAHDAPTVPGPVQQPRPPFVVAGNGPRGMRLALRFGAGWATNGTAPFGSEPRAWWEGIADAARTFDAVVDAAGGAPPGFRRYLDVGRGLGRVTTADKLRDDLLRAADLGYTDLVIFWPRDTEPFAASERVFEQLATHLNDGELS